MIANFDAIADSYEHVLDNGLRITGEHRDYFARGRIASTAAYARQAKLPTNAVLDFGCGTGASTPLLAEALGADLVVGVDESGASLDRARRQYSSSRIQFVAPDELLRSSQVFDVVYTNGVFHHIDPARRVDVLRSIAGVMRPHALLALWENNPWNPGTRWVMRRLPFDRDARLLWPSAAATLLSTTFTVVTTEYRFFFPKLLSPLRRFEPLLAHVPLGGQYVVFATIGTALPVVPR